MKCSVFMPSNNTNHSSKVDNSFPWIVLILFFLVGLFGMVANGTVIWIGCHMKRNSFITYILNLSAADFALLTALVSYNIYSRLLFFRYIEDTFVLHIFLLTFSLFTFSASQFLLAAISIDRCVCLFFPLWHKCHRPSRLSTTVCVTIWILTFLICATEFSLKLSIGYGILWCYQFLLNAVLCMPAVTISTIAMWIKVYFISPHLKRGKFLKAVLLALLLFLFFGFPVNAIVLFQAWGTYISPNFHYYGQICGTLNSAINPVIYFLVGRDKKAQSRGGIKKILEKLFQEEESCKKDVESSLETHL